MSTKDKSPRRRRLGAALDRADRRLFPRKWRVARAGEPARREAPSAAQRALIGALSAVFVVLFIYAVNYYSSTRIRIAAAPLVTNLTRAGLRASVRIGVSPACAGGDCWLRPDFDDAGWQRVRIPMPVDQALDTVEGYKGADKQAMVYYRIWVPVGEELLEQDQEIAFTPVYINHTRYELFLNGRSVGVGNGLTSLGATVNVGIPRADISGGKALLAVKGTLETDLSGISSRGDAFVGPKALLDEVYVHAERAGGTFRLLFLLTKGGIFVVFTLFFLFSSGQRGLYSFLTFAFFSTIEDLFVGDFLTNLVRNLNVLDAGVFMAKILATNALLAYLVDFCAIPFKPKALRAIPATACAVVAGMLFDYGWGTRTVKAQDLLAVTGGYLVGAVFFGLMIGAITLRMWRREGFPQSAVRSLRNLLISLGIYFLLLVWDSTFNTFLGFDKRALFDLLLFYYIAFNTAKDLGHKEGQVRSLETHMLEKRRMELELQEAAEIARAFLPHSLPRWPDFSIAAFHNPLTESSGDWFAFETARGRNLRHFILCDITGHGVQAAIVVSSCKTALSVIVQNYPEILERTDFLTRFAHILNGILFAQGDGHHISTILGLSFDCDAGTLYYLSGGHPLPLFIAAGGHPPRPAALVSRNTVLGAAKDIDLVMSSRPFAPGDAVIAHTDGLPLAPNIKVLREMLASGAFEVSAAQLEALCTKVWEGQKARTGSGQIDDVSVVAFRLAG